MVIAGVIGVCVVLFLLALLAPRLSFWPQKGVDRTLGAGGREGGRAPGIVGHLLTKAFKSSRKAADKSANGGRTSRGNFRCKGP